MKHASLFSGIGGAELAATWMGWKNVFHCEINEFPRKVLEYWYPNSVSYEDITTTDFTSWRGKVDILTGGFPCQPFSMAGKRLGAEDDRYLWPHMLRAIREIQPTWVVGENVAGLVTMVQPSEEFEVGGQISLFDESYRTREEQPYTIEEICQGLEREGYSVQPFVIPACAVGAPHRRDRIWIVARLNTDTDCQRCTRRGSQTYKRDKASKRENVFRNIERPCGEQDVANSANARTESVQQGRKDRISELGLTIDTKCERWAKGWNEYGKSEISQEKECRAEQFSGTDSPQGWWRNFPTKPPICNGNDGLSLGLVNITFPKWRAESVKALGNAIVPQVIYEIFKAIEEYERETT